MTASASTSDKEGAPLAEPHLPDLPLQQALQARRSTRDFLPFELTPGQLSSLLWAAAGVNRRASGGRTMPSAHGWQEVDVYAVTAQGAWRYDASAHRLLPVAPGDLRASTGEQDFVGSAPLNLVYVVDFDRMPEAAPQEREFLCGVSAGAMAQNAYLAAAALGLGSVVRGLIDRRHLAASLGLRTTQRVLLAQTFGVPRLG
ncbi:MAG TPA: nitroreductase family protein [Burkholderiaceae bacterium]